MMESKLMTDHEKADIIMRSIEMYNAGQREEANELRRTVPLQPWLAKFTKEKMGVDVLLALDWNLAEAEAEYGSDWLNS